jgi:uncharacterized DUF497 family protein
VRITYDPDKRAWTLATRGLDFEEAPEVFANQLLELEDLRKEYGERRIQCFGLLNHRLVVDVYTPREGARHVFSMRRANAREQRRYIAKDRL